MFTLEQEQRMRPMWSDVERTLWQLLVQRRTGLYFSSGRLYFLQQRVWERMRALQISNYTLYYQFVTQTGGGMLEWQRLVECLLNHETSWFRHEPSFTLLGEVIFPELARRKCGELSVWSAGCAGGQELYSVGLLLSAEFAHVDWKVHLFGSDLSFEQVKQAKAGYFRPLALRTLPERYRPYFQMIKRGKETGWQIKRFLRDQAVFTVHNLFSPPPSEWPLMDVIICQNVLIYFEREDRPIVMQYLVDQLADDGYLLLGPAEMIGMELPELQAVRLNDSLIYRKKRLGEQPMMGLLG